MRHCNTIMLWWSHLLCAKRADSIQQNTGACRLSALQKIESLSEFLDSETLSSISIAAIRPGKTCDEKSFLSLLQWKSERKGKLYRKEYFQCKRDSCQKHLYQAIQKILDYAWARRFKHKSRPGSYFGYKEATQERSAAAIGWPHLYRSENVQRWIRSWFVALSLEWCANEANACADVI